MVVPGEHRSLGFRASWATLDCHVLKSFCHSIIPYKWFARRVITRFWGKLNCCLATPTAASASEAISLKHYAIRRMTRKDFLFLMARNG